MRTISHNARSPMAARIALIGIVSLCVLWLIPAAYKLFLSDIESLGAKNTITQYNSQGSFSLEQWLIARDQLSQVLSLAPQDPNLLLNAGQLNAMRGYKTKGNKIISKAYYQEAALFYEKSLKIRPLDAVTWLNLTITLQAIQALSPSTEQTNRYNVALLTTQRVTKNEKYLADALAKALVKN
jgi:hypothetical protein